MKGTREYERFTRRRMSWTIGVGPSSERGYGQALNFGGLRPHAIVNKAIELAVVTIGDSFRIDLYGAQIDTKDMLVCTLQEWGSNPITLNWNPTNTRYQATVAGLAAFLTARDGRSLRLSIEPV